MKFEDYSHTFLHFHTMEIPDILKKHMLATKGLGELGVCDLGAGDGNLLISLHQAGLLSNYKKVVAVELSDERCARLREYTDFTVICGDATRVNELPDQSFDLILCSQVIEHVDEQALLSEISRLLKPGGVAYIASVIREKNGWWYYRTADGKWALDPTHLREYESVTQYEGVLKSGGFHIIETVKTRLDLSIIEFVLRRIIVPLFNPKHIHSFFRNYPLADWVRRKFNIHPPGYFIVETVAKKPA